MGILNLKVFEENTFGFLLKGGESLAEILGEHGFLKGLTKGLVE